MKENAALVARFDEAESAAVVDAFNGAGHRLLLFQNPAGRGGLTRSGGATIPTRLAPRRFKKVEGLLAIQFVEATLADFIKLGLGLRHPAGNDFEQQGVTARAQF